MENKSMLYGLIGLVVGTLIGVFIASSVGMQKSSDKQTTHTNANGMGVSMNDMMVSLKNKTGDDFDKAFISGMIDHHQGAIEMAQEAKKSAKHNEIKNLADDIIAAQTKEINEMKKWQQSWGYVQ